MDVYRAPPSRMIIGIVLAAGRSRRMGRPKAFLEVGGETFLGRAVAALGGGGCTSVVVVTGAESDPAHAAIARAARELGAVVAVNPLVGSEQLDSVRAGLRLAAPDAAAAVISPVDVPITRVATVQSVIQRFRESGAPLVVPTHAGTRGHPILLSREMFRETDGPDLPEGLRSLMRRHADRLEEVAVDDPDVLLDVDTPEAYRALVERAR